MVELEPGLPGRIGELRAALAGKDPGLLAARSAAVYTSIEEGTGRFDLAMWGRKVHVSYPDFTVLDEHGQPLDVLSTALLLYYFDRSDSTPIAGRWIAFSELPDGRFYAQAFQGYTGNKNKIISQIKALTIDNIIMPPSFSFLTPVFLFHFRIC